MKAFLTRGDVGSSTATGDIVITGCPFTPKAAIFLTNRKTLDGLNTTLGYWGIGYADGVNQVAQSVAMNAGQSSGDVTISQVNDGCAVWSTLNGNVLWQVGFVSFDSGGITLSTLVTNGTPVGFTVLLLGGDDLTDVKCGFFQKTATTTGLPFTQDITDPGFTPDCVLFSHCRPVTTINFDVQANSNMFWGWAVNNLGTTQQACTGLKDDNALNPTNSCALQTTSSCIKLISPANNTNTVVTEANLNAWITNGFRLQYTTQSDVTASQIMYLALKGGRYAIGSLNQPTSVGITSIDGIGFSPSALMLQSFGRASSGSVLDGIFNSIGMTDFLSQRSHTVTEPDNVSPTTTKEGTQTAKAWHTITTSVLAQAEYLLSRRGRFKLSFDTVDATSREIIYLAMGDLTESNPNPLNFQDVGIM